MSAINSGISVIVCCYNSSARLPDTLKHLAHQDVPENINWEIILVNNASTDDTFAVATAEKEKYAQLKNRLFIVNQPIPGLSHARELGVKEAKYKYIVFCDDDNWLISSYLSNAYQLMENDPTIGALGGQGIAATDATGLPDWFDSIKGSYAVGKQALNTGYITYSLWGAGMVTKKELYQKCFPKDFPSYLTGRNGAKLSAGEDTEFCIRLQLKDYKLYYDESLIYTHFIAKTRLTSDYVENLHRGFSEAISRLYDQTQLVDMKNEHMFGKTIWVSKKILGYISTLFGRKSYQLKDLRVMLYFLTKIDTGIDPAAKKIFSFYKDYHFKLDEK